MSKPAGKFVAISIVLLSVTPCAYSQTILSTGHADIGLNYLPAAPAGQRWDLHVHDEDNDIEYAPDQVVLRVNLAGRTTRPSGSQWDFIGAPAGSEIWVLPQSQAANLLFLGISAGEIGANVFVGNTVNLRLRALSGPGQFSVWGTDAFGAPTPFMTSANGINDGDNIQIPTGAHAHVNYGFTAPGTYLVTFEGLGTPTAAGGDPSSGNVVYTFQVVPVPEPGSGLLAGLAVFGGAACRRRRVKTENK